MSDIKALDPDKRHTALELMEGGVRLQAVHSGAEDVLSWAARNKVDLTQPGDIVAIINSARAIRNLAPFSVAASSVQLRQMLETRKAEQRSRDLPSVTRDGHPSEAAAVEAYVARPGDVPFSTAKDWADANRFTRIQDGRPFIDQINDERRRLNLPLFRIKPKAGTNPLTTPGQTALNALPAVEPSNEPIVSTISPERGNASRWKGLPTTAAELLDMATSFVGVVSGLVTPALAQMLLDLNSENRNLNDDGVNKLAKAIQSGRWINDGNPIKIASNGVLNDGQHRLHAIIKSGIAVEMDLRFGVQREAFVVTDTGMRRTNGQILAMAGRQYSTMQGALCRLVVRYDEGEMHRLDGGGVEGDVAVRMTEENPDFGRVATLLRALKFKPIKSSYFGFVLVIAARELSFEKAQEFALLTDSGQGDEESPTRRLNVRLRDAGLSKGIRLRSIDVCAMSVLMWNAWIESRPVQVVRVHESHRTGPGFPKLVFK